MAYGELVITCRTKDTGEVDIKKGDAIQLVGDYSIDNYLPDGKQIFGQALAASNQTDQAIPVKVRGVCVFAFIDVVPNIGHGICGTGNTHHKGQVRGFPPTGTFGTVLKVNTETNEVHVLL